MNSIKIEWFGHSCFRISYDGFSAVIDPYEDGYIPGLKPLRLSADAVYCSHGHGDHNAKELVELSGRTDNPFKITEIHSWHDDVKGAKRGANIIRIFEADGIKIAHFGDIGCFPTDEQKILLSNLNAAMVPVGGFYTMEPNYIHNLVNELNPEVVIPCHYSGLDYGFNEIQRVDAFLEFEDNIKFSATNTIEIERNNEHKIVVLKYK